MSPLTKKHIIGGVQKLIGKEVWNSIPLERRDALLEYVEFLAFDYMPTNMGIASFNAVAIEEFVAKKLDDFKRSALIETSPIADDERPQ